MGDFNEIVLPSEVEGGKFYANRASKFDNVIDKCRLIDLDTIGSFFTWYRKDINFNTIFKRLDRALGDYN